MNRRTFLAAGLATTTPLLAGCTSEQVGTRTPSPSPTASRTDVSTSTPLEVDISYAPDDYGTVEVNGVAVPLVPINDAIEWHRNDTAVFVDARGEPQYEKAHIKGAVNSHVSDGSDPGAVGQFSTDTRIVTYCGCPHHLSSIRALSLLTIGYEEVYALDEGFFEWQDRGYPLAGEDVDSQADLHVVKGRTNPASVGRYSFAHYDGRIEAAPIAADGTYALHIRFEVSPTDVVTVETPDYTVEAPLEKLVDGIVTG